MVRKRNKSPIDNKDPASHRLVERLANILELSGVWRDSEDDDDDPWESLASSLEKIATHMKKLESEEIFDLKLDDLLLGFEQTAQDVRAQGDILLDCIRENRIELDLFQEIESFCDLQEFSRLRPLFRSLLSAMKYQRFLARDVIQNALLKITHLYSDDNSDGPNTKDFIADIRNDALLIRTRCLDAKNSPWKEAEAFIKELERNQSTKVESLIEAINSSCAGAESICDNVSVATDEAKGSPTNPHPNLLSSESIAEAVLKFSSHHASSSHKSFSILLVGPEGSGKTHNCDLIEKIVPPDVHGKEIPLSVSYTC